MQSVTSNAVAKSLSYSTDEIDTGTVWKDGKKIYKKTYQFTNVTMASGTNVTLGQFSGFDINDIIKNEIMTYATIGGIKRAFSEAFLKLFYSGTNIIANQEFTGSTITATINLTIYYQKNT